MNKPYIVIATDNASYSLIFPEMSVTGCHLAIARQEGPNEKSIIEILSPLTVKSDCGMTTVSANSSLGKVVLTVTPASDGTVPALALRASLELDRKLRGVEILPFYDVTLDKATHLLSHGRSMGGCTTCKLPADVLEVDPGEVSSAAFTSHFQTMISFNTCKLHITQPLMQQDVTTTKGCVDKDSIRGLSVQTRFEFPIPGKYESETTTISVVTDGFKAMRDWGDSQQNTALPREPQPIGWNSWDYYRWTITEDEVLKNAEFIASDPILAKYVKRIIVDDGWQYCYGEWEPNPFFKSGMDSLACKLRAMGFVPGMWICPGIAEPHSMIAEWNTDWLAMSEGGDPCLSFSCMERKGFIIDPTLPEVKQWLHGIFTKYADMGYGYFKTDFLMPVCNAPRYHREVPRGQLIRELMTPITDAIRGKATLLGCGYDYNGGCDIVRMVRAGGDIHATWGNVRSNAISIAARFWASNRVWITDPDFCVCRGPETSADPDLGRLRCLYVGVKPEDTKRGPLPEYLWSNGLDTILAHEAQCLLSLAIINGGALNLSDKLYVLNKLGLDLIRRTVSASRGSAPTPIDLFETNLASKWIQETPTGYRVLLINWNDIDAEVEFDLSKHGINVCMGKNFWTDEPVEIKNNKISGKIRAHGCLFVEL